MEQTMTWFESMLLGILQGLTEFLPISSSGHLVVAQGVLPHLHETRGNELLKLSGSDALFFNVMLHLGTLVAILVYFRGTLTKFRQSLDGRSTTSASYPRALLVHGAVLAIAATIPAAFVGLFFKGAVERATSNPALAGLGFLVTATILIASQRLRSGQKQLADSTVFDALFVGLAQAMAIMPGISRSGMTIVAALILGFARPWAVGFSLLMAIPAILGAGVLELRELDFATVTTIWIAKTMFGAVVAGLVGYLAIIWLIRIVQQNRLWYFSVYLIFLAILVLLNFPIRGDTDGGSPKTTALALTARHNRLHTGPRSHPAWTLDHPVRIGSTPDPSGALSFVDVSGRHANLDVGRSLD